MPIGDALTRFSSRVQDYVRYRPGYPAAVMECLTHGFGLSPTHIVADVGSGTGISSELFLRNGNQVLGIEPNDEMRSAAQRRLEDFPGFRSVAGTAEATTLPDCSVDWVVAAQAFHWFNVDACRQEFQRILRPQGQVVLLWNDRRDETPFMREYEEFVHRYSIDYDAVSHRNAETDGRIDRLFGPKGFQTRTFANHQDFDFDGLQGRVTSSSYMPGVDHPRFTAMTADLQKLHAGHAVRGLVRFEYDTKMFVGSPFA